jgi:Amt family ammonium transporter
VDRQIKRYTCALIALLLLAAAPAMLLGADAAAPPDPVAQLTAKVDELNTAIGDNKMHLDTVWTLVAGMLVFFMNLGFGMLESGLCRAKNCVNICAKNFIVFACASLAYLVIGWGLMFGSGNPFVGTEGLFFANNGRDNSPVSTSLADTIKEEIAAKFELDFEDEATAKKYEALLSKVDEDAEKARKETTSNTRTVKVKEMKDGKEVEVEKEEDVTVKVSYDVADKGRFEGEYKASSFYWGPYPSISWAAIPLWAKFFFQLVFAGTAATIVSGAVAERIKFSTFIVFSFILCGVIYPVIGHLIWGGGYLGSGGMWDFAGSTVVHSTGGWAALAGVIVLGPRLGKYGPNGEVNPIPGHNLQMVTLGGLVLWFGWFGFNPGSTMGADGPSIGHIAVTTNTAAAAATVSAALTAWLFIGKPDLTMIINGTLAGLVAITAPCAFVGVGSSLIIGLIAGVLVVFAVLFFDKIKLDDPVGALSVHLVNGVWGTLAVGLFATDVDMPGCAAAGKGLLMGGGFELLKWQIIGVVMCGAITFILSMVCWSILKAAMGLRVSNEEQIEGLDLGEHDQAAYPDFQITSIKSYHIREA